MNDRARDILHRLDRRQFEKALELLGEEQRANKLSRAQRIVYRLFMMATYGLLILMVGLIAIFVLFPQWAKEERYFAVLFPVFILLVILIVSIPLLFLLNLTILRKAYYQARLVRKLNLQAIYAMSWRGQKKRRRRTALFRVLIYLLGLFFIIGAFITLEKTKAWEVLLFVSIGLAMVGANFISLWKRKMDTMMDVDNLKESFVKYSEAAEAGNRDFIEVPLDTMAQIARIEASQIARQRAAAIDGMKKAAEPMYTARRAKSFQGSIARLEVEDRLAIEEQIEGLLNDPRPGNALPSNDPNKMTLNLPGMPYILTYTVDDALRQIDLQSIENVDRPSTLGATEVK